MNEAKWSFGFYAYIKLNDFDIYIYRKRENLLLSSFLYKEARIRFEKISNIKIHKLSNRIEINYKLNFMPKQLTLWGYSKDDSEKLIETILSRASQIQVLEGYDDIFSSKWKKYKAS